MTIFRGSGFIEESFSGLHGERYHGLVLHISRSRQAVFLGFVLVIVVAAWFQTLSAWSTRGSGSLTTWFVSALAVLIVVYVVAGGRSWLQAPYVGLSDVGLVIRAFGGATEIPWASVRAVTLDASRGRPRLTLQLAPGTRVERRGRDRLEAPFRSGTSVLVPVNMFAVSPVQIRDRIESIRRRADDMQPSIT